MILSPCVGAGISSANSKCYDSASLGSFFKDNNLNMSSSSFATPKNEFSRAINGGFRFDVFDSTNVAFTTGLLYADTPFRLTYKNVSGGNDVIVKMNYSYLIVPVGFRYYIKEIVLVGCGLYYGARLSNSTEITYGSIKLSDGANSKNDVGVFSDFGFNIPVFENNSIMTFLHGRKSFVKMNQDAAPVKSVRIYSVVLTAAYGFKF